MTWTDPSSCRPFDNPPVRADGYAPIEDYAAIGDGRTCALVARDGSIDWLALPRFDGETVFARLLDAERGGSFELAPEGEFDVAREYAGDSNVLRTTFTTAGGTVRVTDAITLDHGGLLPWFELVRRIEGVDGSVPMRWRVTPRFGAGESDEEFTLARVRDAVAATTRSRTVTLHAFAAGEVRFGSGEISGSFATAKGSDSVLALRSTHDEPIPVARRDWIERRIDDTADDWERWLADAGVDGPWRAATRRSGLALRLLTFVPTGAIVAAPTTSLPEWIGEDKNYDYRYAWVRDTAFTLDALINLDLLVQVHASFAWLLQAVEATGPNVHVFYDLDGNLISKQRELELDGYRGSRPVRRGNRAADQLQLGCWGDLLETAELYAKAGNSFDAGTAEKLADSLDRLAAVWRKQDAGIWELPETEHYTTSKIAVWTAFDRALRLVAAGELPVARESTWRAARDEVREFVESECWSDARRCYTMHPGTTDLDASVLRVSRTGYLDPRSERFSGLIDAIREELGAGGPLLYRLSGARGREGAFVACSFWLVEALARADRLAEARTTMDELVALANDVGLFAEEIDPATHAFLGNFPQGLSHLSLVNAAAAIREATS
jgi:GH15 family glucan-1,4-alpha-glucosidase